MKDFKKAIKTLSKTDYNDIDEDSFWMYCSRCNEVHLFNKFTDPECKKVKLKELKIE